MDTLIITQQDIPSLMKERKFRSLVNEAFSATMPDLVNPIEKDPRFKENSFLVNDNFIYDPIFFAAIHMAPEDGSVSVASIYIFPKYRGKGISKLVFRFIAEQVPANVTIQLSVEAKKIEKLDPYYKKLGFKTTGVKTHHNHGGYLVDYFWCKCYLELEMADDQKTILAQRRGLRPETEWELYK